MEELKRLELLVGADGISRLWQSHVAVFGIGGVGSFAAEVLARSGIGTISLFDDDVVSITNINRQLIALHSTIGMKKVDVMASRIQDINPSITVHPHSLFYLPETDLDFSCFDFVIDAIDTVSSKLALIEQCQRYQVPVISSMGTGNKMDASLLKIADISETSVCPLARVMRKELRSRGILHGKVLFSTEPTIAPINDAPEADCAHPKRQTPGSTAFVPPIAGMMIAGEAIRTLLSGKENSK